MHNQLLSHYLESKIAELEALYDSKEFSNKTFTCEKIILFFATFSPVFPESLKDKINVLFQRVYNANQSLSVDELVYKYSSLIILQKVLGNDIQNSVNLFQSIVDYTGHHKSSNRRVFTFLLVHILDNKFKSDYSLLYSTFVEELFNLSKKNIESFHLGNQELFSLFLFLNMPFKSKIEYFEQPHIIAKAVGQTWDSINLERLKSPGGKFANPFFEDFLETQKYILNEIFQPRYYNFNKEYQPSLFESTDESAEIFNFIDKRLQQELILN